MNWTWLGGLGIFAVGAVGIWYSVTRTDYLPKLAWWLIQQMLPVILKRMTPEQEAALVKTLAEGGQWDFAKKKPKDWGH